ncbi:amino acid adenylation domain-containing protein [Streptomyces sp. BHT-5-2]|uniref:non-ribosomal peptide synthetase n=1 Tax=Streptomyces sp. BHT-5-2 TaxID=2866715 RepID=UPI001C8D8FE3|nr:non-ribosomal peptide synthetase [Streptomyces sp. BHT-5-2]QZL05574.1 amino acid adenylation domain-containing protein [Streptomyces sp. BHT-5-2]
MTSSAPDQSENPTTAPASRAARTAALPAHARELLRARLAGKAAAAPGAEPIPRLGHDGPVPLSPAQERLWYLHELEPDSNEYNTLRVLRLHGRLDLDALTEALTGVVARHGALRTTFDSRDGRAQQTVHPPGKPEFPLVDLSAAADDERDDALRTLLLAEARRPFDLRRGPVLRAQLVRLAADDHVLALGLHHIVTDGWSTGVLQGELTALYTAAVRGEPARLPELPVRFTDVAAWQHDRLTAERLAEGLDHWRRALAGLTPLDLPTTRPRPPVRTSAGALHTFEVPPRLTAGLKALGREHGATLFMTLVAAVQLLLSRRTGQVDLAVGTAAAGRGRPETEHLVGFFVNNLVLRTRIAEDRPFTELLTAVRGTVLDAFAHEDVPFQRVVEALRPERDPSRPPLAEVAVNLHNTPRTGTQVPGLRIEEMLPPVVTSSMELAFDFTERDGRLDGHLTYNTDLFDADAAARTAAGLLTLLDDLTARPAVPVAELAVLPATERREVTEEWPHSGPGRPARTIPELFAEQVARTPEADALVTDEETLDYAELDARANRLARLLLARGAGPEKLVALALPRSAETVVAILAVLKAGAAYLPLDPRNPAERNRLMVQDARPLLVLTVSGFDGGTDLGAPALLLDGPEADTARYDGAPPTADELPALLLPGHPAYVIYTSGSTGRPKGVVVTHAGAHGLAAGQSAHFRSGPGARVLSFAALGFDAGFSEFGMALLSGGALVVVDQERILPGPSLTEVLAAHRVTHVTLPPGALSALTPGTLPADLTLIVAGESCPPAVARTWSAHHRMINAYGPTEATVCASMSRPLTPDTVGAAVPVGRPLPGVRVSVLDDRLRPVPAGVPGEVYLSGIALARGYLGRTALTAERFVADPYGPPGSRMYRTGDRARWLPDGDLDYLGRTDDQVKVRGFRIELGEVEAVLSRHDGVTAVAAAVHKDERGTRRLVAYAVPAAPTGPTGFADTDTAARLREFARGALPEHMVPSVVVLLDRLPENANGKVDRRALPAPDLRRTGHAPRIAPRTPAERTLARIWSEVLGVDDLGVEDNFFDLGGDSILSLQVVARARAAGLRVTAKQTFLRQTVADLAAEAVAEEATAGPAAADDGPVTGELPLTPIQHWFFDTLGASLRQFNQSLYLELAEDPDHGALRTALAALTAHHDALRLRAEPDGDRWRLHHAAAETGELLVPVDLSGLAPQAQDAAMTAAIDAAQRGFDLAEGPLLRARLFALGADRPARLYLVAHHLVVDGMSWRILLADLETGYRQALAGRPVDLGPRTTSFRDWSRRLSRHATEGGLRDELPYWEAASAAARRAAPLPVDFAGTPDGNTAGSARTVTARLSAAATDALLRQVPEAYRTQINDVLLSALGRVLADWTGGDRVLVALEGHGREDLFEDVDLSRTVGWFTTVFPVALQLPGDRDWGAVLKSVKEQLRAVPRNGLGHGVLRHLAGPDTRLATGPEPEVGFNYLGRLEATAGPGGLARALLDSPGAERAADQRRHHLLEINGQVTGGRLEFAWTYSAERHRTETVERLAAAFMAALEAIVAHCAEPGSGGATPSDFPLAALDQPTVDRMVGDGRAVEDVYPLTPMQSGMLFHALSESGRDPYTGHFGVRIDGVTDPGALAAAWQQVVDRTPALRTAIVWQDVAEPMQVVHRTARVPVTHHDLRTLPEQDRRAALDELWARRTETVVDLAQPPALRLTLVRLTDTAVQMYWTSHHILMDGWSFAGLLSEVCAGYAALTGGPRSAAPARRPYRDYVRWLGEQDEAAARAHWRSVVEGFTVPTPLPYDRQPVKAHGTRSSREVQVTLSAERTARLTEAARAARLTVNTLVQGAWAALLARYSGAADVCFGTTVSGRPATLPGAEAMAGLFINTVPVRARLDGTPAVEWLRDLQGAQLDSRQYEHVSLAQIQRASGVPAGTNLFDSIVVFENYPYDGDAAAAYGLGLGTFQGDEVTNYALTLTAYAADTLHLNLGYDPDLFDEATVRRLTGHLATLLDGIATAPGTPMDDLPLLDAAERERLLVRWNDTATAFPPPRPVHELFAERAARTPDAVAVTDAERRLTFAELETRANQLAHHLVGLGVGPGTLVGVCADRGVDAVVALLGVLRAGGAFVPLDPAYPAERLRIMLTDAAVPVVVTEERLLDRVAGHDAVTVCLDRELPLLQGLPAGPPQTAVTPEDLAYVIYTSGTTGRPKGVMVEHRHVHHMLHGWDRRYGLAALRPRALSVSSISVDLFFSDFLLSALFGGTMVICPQDAVADQVALTDLLLESRAQLMVTVPTLARAVVAELTWRGIRPEDLRVLMVGSEGWPADAAAEILDGLAPGTVLVNAYGSTETTVDSTVFQLGRDPLGDAAFVPVGRPLANTRIYVLDARMRPVPTGVAGECYIGGDGVSRGYLGRPELTAERFLDDPFAPEPGARMYRTGDLARWRADGNLECLGRVDDQVKVRGFRVELGEVEAVLARHPDVSAAAAAVRRDDGGPARLVGYVVPAAGRVPDPGALRAFAAERLPAPAVPTAYVVLDALPMTPSGTVARRALPAPAGGQDPARPYAPPTDGTELLLCGIWQEVLGIERVGVHDNFFELGGDSILSIRVISRIRASLGVAPSPRQLFDTPTVAALAAALGRQAPTDGAGLPLVPADRDAPLPLSSAQQRQWFLHDFDPDSSEYHIVTGLRLGGTPDAGALQRALTGLVARHEALRTTYEAVDGGARQVVHPAAEVPWTRTDLSGVPAQRREDALREEVARAAARPFSLAEGPVLRAELFRLDARDHLLLLVVHHIATDGASMAVLCEELGVLYAAELAGTAPALPELPVAYADYAAWQRRMLSGPALDGQLAYWREQLAGVRPLALPTDRPRPAVRSSAGRMLLVDVEPRVAAGLKELARRHDATLFMVLTAAVQLLLARWTGRPDIVVGTPSAGRPRQELEGVVGLFVNTVAIRSTVEADRTFGELLESVRGTVLEAFEHAEVPFDRLVEVLRPRRDPSRNALVEVFVGLETDRSAPPALPGLTVTEVPYVSDEVSHDLSFDFVDQPDGLRAAIGYSTALFDEATVERLAGRLLALLAAAPEDSRAVSELVPAGPGEAADPAASPSARQAGHDGPDAEGDDDAAWEAAAPYRAPATDAERTLAEIWAAVLGVPRVGTDDNFFQLGGDSLLSIQAVQRMRQAGLAVTTRDLFVHQSIRPLAAQAADRAAARAAETGPAPAAEDAAAAGPIPLTPAQHDYFAAVPLAPHHFTQSVLVELHADTDLAALRRALTALVDGHEALRHRFVREAGAWRQYATAPRAADVLRQHDLSELPTHQRATAMDELAAEADAGLALGSGPLFAALLFTFGPGERPALFLTAHHLVVDGVSWRILLADLEDGYGRARGGAPVSPAAPGSTFGRWAHRLARHVADGALDAEAAYWRGLPPATEVPRDGVGPAVVESVQTVTVELPEDLSEVLLRRSAGVFRTRFHEVLFAALAGVLSRWTGERQVVFDTEGHGREELFEDLDLSRTVGWFTTEYPVALDVGDDPDDWPALVKGVRRQLRALPGNGFGYGALRRLGPAGSPGAALAERAPAQLVFNYHGQADEAQRAGGSGLYHAFGDPIGREQRPDEVVRHPLEVVGAVQAGRLRFTWYFSRNVHHRATVAKVADDFADALRALARHVQER